MFANQCREKEKESERESFLYCQKFCLICYSPENKESDKDKKDS